MSVSGGADKKPAGPRAWSATHLTLIACGALLANGTLTLLQGLFGGSSSSPFRGSVLSLGRAAMIAGAVSLGVALGAVRWKYGTFWPKRAPPDRIVVRAFLWAVIGWLALMVVPPAIALSRNPYRDVTWLVWGLQDNRWLIAGYLLTVVSAVALPPLAGRFLDPNRFKPGEADTSSPRRMSRWRLVAVVSGAAVALALFAPPWNIEYSTGQVGNHDVHLSQLQAIHTGAVPYVGEASIQYGPGSQILQYAYMTLANRFSLLGYRETYALSMMLGFAIFTATVIGVLGARVGALASFLALYVSPFTFFRFGGTILGGLFGWANSFRYLGTLLVLTLTPAVVVRGRGWWNGPAILLGLCWGFFSYMSQENLATTVLAAAFYGLVCWGFRAHTIQQMARMAVCCAAGLALFWTPVLIAYAAAGELGRFLESYTLVSRFVAAGMSNTSWDTASNTGWNAAFYLTAPVIVVAGWLTIFDWNGRGLRQPLSYERQTLLAAICASLVCFSGALLRKDSSHFINVLTGLPVVLAALAAQTANGRAPWWFKLLLLAGLAVFVAQFPSASRLLQFPRDYVLEPLKRFEGAPPDPGAWAGDSGIAFERAGQFTDSRYVIFEDAAPARVFFEEMNAVHAIVGDRPAFVHSYPGVPPEIVYFFADLKPGPLLFNKSTMVFNFDVEARFLENMDARCPEFRTMIGVDGSAPEVMMFHRCHPDAVEIPRTIAGDPYFIWAAQGS